MYFLLLKDHFWIFLTQMAHVPQRRQNGYIPNKQFLAVFFIFIFGLKMLKNVFSIIMRQKENSWIILAEVARLAQRRQYDNNRNRPCTGSFNVISG